MLRRLRKILLGFSAIAMFMVSAPVFAQEIAVQNLLDVLAAQEEDSEPEEPAVEEPCANEAEEVEYYCQQHGRESAQCIRAQMREALCIAALHCSEDQWDHLSEILQGELDQCIADAGRSEVEQLQCHLNHMNNISQVCQDEVRQPGIIAAIERRVCEEKGEDGYEACIQASCPGRETRACRRYCSAVENAIVSRCLYLEDPVTPGQAACDQGLQQCMASADNYIEAARCYMIYNSCIKPPLV